MKKNTILLLFLLANSFLFAQKITSQAINASGGTQQTSGYSLTYSIGQTATTTLKNTNYIITQGFQQVEKNTSVSVKNDADKITFRATLFPNPTQDILNINIENTENDNFKIIIFNITGQLVFQNIFSNNTLQLEVGHLPVGDYILKLQSMKNQKTMVSKFLKL